MILESIGGVVLLSSLGTLAWQNRPEQLRVRMNIRSVIVKKGIAHTCMAGGKKIKIHPTVEYVIPKDYGYRVLIHLPDSIKIAHFLARQDIFEHKVGYPIVFNTSGDILFMDVVTAKNEVILPMIGDVENITPEAPVNRIKECVR